MSIGVLCGVILMQVAIFQFAAVRMARRLPDYLVGDTELPAGVAAGIGRFRSASGKVRYGLGALLIASAILATWVLPLPPAARKLTLAAISVISGAGCVIGYVHDRIKLSAVAGELPSPSVRSASLLRPRLDLHYSPAWEMIPLLIVLGTIGVSLWAAFGVRGTDALALLALPLVQALYVFGALAYTVWNTRSGSRLTQSAKAFMGSPEQVIRIEEALKDLNLRFFMASKVMVALLLAAIQVELILTHLGLEVPAILDLSSWALVVLLLLLFLVFMARASALRSAEPS